MRTIIKRAICAVLILCLVFSLSVVSFAKDMNEEANSVDFVFVIDISKNIESKFQKIISVIKTKISEFDNRGFDYRVAFIEYRDISTQTDNKNDYSYKVSGFMTGSASANSYINTITLSSKYKSGSCLFSALIDGSKKLSFRQNAVHAFFVIGQQPCYDPEPDTGYNWAVVLKTFSLSDNNDINSCPYIFYTYNLSNNATCEKYFKLLAQKSCGRYIAITSSNDDFVSDLNSQLDIDFYNVLYTVSSNVPSEETVDERIKKIINNTPSYLRPLVRSVLRVYLMIYNLMNK